MTARPCRRRKREEGEKPKVFGEIVTADHIVLGETDMGGAGERAALVVRDLATGWISCYPLPNKSADSARNALDLFEGPRRVVQLFYSDNAPELIAAAIELGWPLYTSDAADDPKRV